MQHGVETPQKTKLKLRLGSKSSSKAQQGPTYTPTTATTAAERDQLYRQYLMTHGRHILGVSTLQQDQLHHFVVPGGSPPGSLSVGCVRASSHRAWFGVETGLWGLPVNSSNAGDTQPNPVGFLQDPAAGGKGHLAGMQAGK